MLRGIYAVRDYKVGFTNVVTDYNDDTAVRGFKSALSPESLMFNNPKDFALFKLGEYDTDTGVIIPCEPTLIEEAYNLMPKGDL